MDLDQTKGKFIGEKKIELAIKTEEKTPGGFPIIEIMYKDKTTEWVSSLMFWKVVTDKPCDASALRDKRVNSVITDILAILRDWGIKTGELPYISALLNNSLDFNQKEAMIELWSKWMPRPLSLDDIDMITIDRVLRSVKKE